MLDARHGCVNARGTRQVDSTTVTVATRGSLSEPAAQAAVLAMIATGRDMGTPNRITPRPAAGVRRRPLPFRRPHARSSWEC
jgi:hypothetical protein